MRPAPRALVVGLVAGSLLGCSGGDDSAPPSVCPTSNTVSETIRFGGAPKGGALAIFAADGETPVQVKAEADGTYSVELGAARYQVTAEEGDYCKSVSAKTLVFDACLPATLDLELECVL